MCETQTRLLRLANQLGVETYRVFGQGQSVEHFLVNRQFSKFDIFPSAVLSHSTGQWSIDDTHLQGFHYVLGTGEIAWL